MINDERHKDIGGDRETRERAGPDFVDEQKSGCQAPFWAEKSGAMKSMI